MPTSRTEPPSGFDVPQELRADWIVVAGAFLVLLAGWGTIYAYAALAPALASAAGVSPQATSLVFAIAAGCGFIAGAISGPVADRVGPRTPAIVGVLCMGAGLALAAGATSLTGLCLTFGLLVGTGVGLAYVPAMAAVACRFAARRGLACGLAAAGIGAGTALVPLIATALEPAGGLRLPLMAVLTTGLGAAGALMLGRRIARAEPAEGESLGTACRTPAFARLYLGLMLASVPAALPFAELVSHAERSGVAHERAIGLLALIGLGSVLGRIVLGFVSDRIGRATALRLCCVGMGAATLLWAGGDAGLLVAFPLIFGVFQGGFVALSSAVAVDMFGRRAAGGIGGLLLTGRSLGVVLGVPVIVHAMSSLGDAPALGAAAALALIGCAILAGEGAGGRVFARVLPMPDASLARSGCGS